MVQSYAGAVTFNSALERVRCWPSGQNGLLRWYEWWRPCLLMQETQEMRVRWVGKISRRGKWPPTPVLLPGQRSLIGCSPWGPKEPDMTQRRAEKGRMGRGETLKDTYTPFTKASVILPAAGALGNPRWKPVTDSAPCLWLGTAGYEALRMTFLKGQSQPYNGADLVSEPWLRRVAWKTPKRCRLIQ